MPLTALRGFVQASEILRGVTEPVIASQVSTRQFARLTLSAPITDDITVMNFRHLLEKHKPAPAILAVINGYLQKEGLSLRHGIIVNTTIIHAPNLTKNEEGSQQTTGITCL